MTVPQDTADISWASTTSDSWGGTVMLSQPIAPVVSNSFWLKVKPADKTLAPTVSVAPTIGFSLSKTLVPILSAVGSVGNYIKRSKTIVPTISAAVQKVSPVVAKAIAPVVSNSFWLKVKPADKALAPTVSVVPTISFSLSKTLAPILSIDATVRFSLSQALAPTVSVVPTLTVGVGQAVVPVASAIVRPLMVLCNKTLVPVLSADAGADAFIKPADKVLVPVLSSYRPAILGAASVFFTINYPELDMAVRYPEQDLIACYPEQDLTVRLKDFT